MKPVILLIVCFSAALGFAQKDSVLVQREKTLSLYLDRLRTATNDTEKEDANQVFRQYLLETIKLDGAFGYPFSALKTLGTVKSPDDAFRFFNWNVEKDDETFTYYCYILKKDARSREWTVIELTDNSLTLPARPDDVLNEDQWYGALYYRVIPVEKSGKTYYTLLGWDGNTSMSNIKLIDVLYFSGNHAKLGNGIFKTKEGTQKRLFFEHSERAVMSLNYDEQRQRIIFDHLSPESPGMEDFREYYVPDMSYDALVFDNNKWTLKEDVIGVNSGDPKKITISAIDEKSGQVVEKEVKNTWIDPSNPNAPAGGSTHVAILPDEPVTGGSKETKKESEFSEVKKGSRKKKEEFSTYPYNDLKGRKKKKSRSR